MVLPFRSTVEFRTLALYRGFVVLSWGANPHIAPDYYSWSSRNRFGMSLYWICDYRIVDSVRSSFNPIIGWYSRSSWNKKFFKFILITAKDDSSV